MTHVTRAWSLTNPDTPVTYMNGTVEMVMPSLSERFWSHVDKNGPIMVRKLGPCWLWTAYVEKLMGYGIIGVGKSTTKAHRVAFHLAHGYLPKTVTHQCDNPPCVNPSHLRDESQAKNLEHMRSMGRAGGVPRKEFCQEDHPMSGANLYLTKTGVRGCRACRTEAVRRYRARRQAVPSA